MKHQTTFQACRSYLSSGCLRGFSRKTAGSKYPIHRFSTRQQHSTAESSNLPRIAQSSLWEAIFPKKLRERSRELLKSPQKGPVNPARYFIWIYLLIGSQAIRILSLQNEFNTYIRRADLKINKLREVVDKLQRGESVDVEKILGTGDEIQEQEWEDALREIEDEERMWQEGKRRREADRKKMEEEQVKLEAERQDASPVSDATAPVAPTAPGFY